MDQTAAVVTRFRQLLRALTRGEIKTNTFERWEVDILLDILAQNLSPEERVRTIGRYQTAALREMRESGGMPIRFSLYLSRQKRLGIRRRSDPGGNAEGGNELVNL